MSWTAIVPLKAEAQRKSRLAAALDLQERVALSHRLFERVAAALAPASRLWVLAELPPPGWTGTWQRDEGRGLNAELDAAIARAGPGRIAIVHADLMLVEPADIAALLAGADAAGAAIAPDHAGVGTNALALADGRRPAMCFGPDSFRRFRAALGPGLAIVRRPGLAHDCDTPADLARIGAG